VCNYVTRFDEIYGNKKERNKKERNEGRREKVQNSIRRAETRYFRAQTLKGVFALSSPSVLKNNDGFGNGAPPHLGDQKNFFSPLRGFFF
jgi:hypothetical protein